MNEEVFFGKYLTDPKGKTKKCWVNIKNGWVGLSKFQGPPFFLFFPLNLASVSNGKGETNNDNCILLETTYESGSIRVFLMMTNRFTCISLLNKIKEESYALKQILTQINPDKGVYFETEEKFMLMKVNHKFSLNENGFTHIQNNKKTEIPLSNILAVIASDDGNHFTVRRGEKNNFKEEKYGPVSYQIVKDMVQYFSAKVLRDQI